MMLYDCVAHYSTQPMAIWPALVGEGFLACLPTRSWSHGLRDQTWSEDAFPVKEKYGRWAGQADTSW
jgi:hypothetical protein